MTATTQTSCEEPERAPVLEEDFQAWCIEQTKKNGYFTATAAVDRGYGGRRWIVNTLLAPYLDDGTVERVPAKGFRWTDLDESTVLAEEFERFAEWASDQTRTRGRFGKRAATKAGLGTAWEIDLFLERAFSNGLVKKLPGKRSGYEWQDVEVEFDVEGRCLRNGITEAQFAALERDFIEWSTGQDNFTIKATVKRYRIGYPTAHRLIDPLIERGEIVELSGGQQRLAWKGRFSESGTLATLVKAAGEAVDPEEELSPGRKAKGESRTDGILTKSQFTSLKTAANRVATEIGDGGLESVSLRDTVFSWDPEHGEGEWTVIYQMREWTTSETKVNRRKLVSGAGLLVDFGLAVGLIDGDAPALRSEVHAAEWQPFIDEMYPVLLEANEGRNELWMRKGLEMLALFATRRGEISPENVNWKAVRDSLEERRAEDPEHWRWNAARRVYRHLFELEILDGPEWPLQMGPRRSLVPGGIVKESAKTGDFSGWTTRDGVPLSGLAGDLATYHRWATADPLRLDLEGLPPHDYVDPTPPQERYRSKMEKRGKGDSLFHLELVTIKPRLYWINLYLGFLHDHDSSIDLSTAGLLDICDIKRYLKFEEWMKERRMENEGQASLPWFLLTLASALAVICSPFLEQLLLGEGDHEGAATARERAEHLRKYYTSRKGEAEQRKDLDQIIEAWKGADGREPWFKLMDMRELELELAERELGMSLDDQVIALKKGTLETTLAWALHIRAAFLINLVRLIPFRRWTLSRIATNMWKQIAVEMDQMNRTLEMHEGAIILDLPAAIMKSDKPFRCPYIERTVVGSKRHEFGARRDLIQLYFGEGGARDRLRRLPNGELVDSPYLLVATAARLTQYPHVLETRKCRWQPEKISEYFHKLVVRHAAALKIDLNRLKELGGTRIHIARGIFGSYWGPKDLVMTADILHHGDVKITKEKYCADGAETAKREVPQEEYELRMEAASEPEPTIEDVMERLRELEEENARLRAAAAPRAA